MDIVEIVNVKPDETSLHSVRHVAVLMTSSCVPAVILFHIVPETAKRVIGRSIRKSANKTRPITKLIAKKKRENFQYPTKRWTADDTFSVDLIPKTCDSKGEPKWKLSLEREYMAGGKFFESCTNTMAESMPIKSNWIA
jgi:hypothetical protein